MLPYTTFDSISPMGKSHHSDVRILAFKRIRVIFRCWKSYQPYKEVFIWKHLESVRKTLDGSPQILGWARRTLGLTLKVGLCCGAATPTAR